MKKQVLLVENGSRPNLAIREWASKNNIQLSVSGNGIEALIWLGKGNIPDLIFAEEQMGLIPGGQFVQYLKSSGFFQDIPIVAFGHPSKHEQLAAMMASGAVDYIFSPINSSELDNKFSHLLVISQVA